METKNVGIDYGNGMTNVDVSTGIRYGVISIHEVLQVWADSSEADYGEPTCPKCGNTAYPARDDFDYTAECGVMVCNSSHVHYPMEIDETEQCPDCGEKAVLIQDMWDIDGYEYHCTFCRCVFDSDNAYGATPIEFTLDDGEYTAIQSADDTDIFITKSTYYTRCEYCSPCAPGAGYIVNEVQDGIKAYCFGHDWFDDGKAPYTVYRVSDDSIVNPE